MEYEWDEVKRVLNRRKHGVDFPDVIAALEDLNRLEEADATLEHGEERTVTIGMAYGRVLFVVTTLRNETTCRIISARKATRHEEDWYFAGDHEAW